MCKKVNSSVLKTIIILAATWGTASCIAQPGATDKQRDKVNELCPGAEIIEVEVKSGYTEIEFLCNGKIIEAGFNDDDELIYTEKEVDLSDTDAKEEIEKKLEKKYEGWTFDESLIVALSDTSFYKIEMVKEGIEENVYFTLDGKYYKPFSLGKDEAWTVKSLTDVYRHKRSPYNFLHPDKVYDMPEILLEISGIVLISENTMFCVQDELGAIFSFDLKKKEITDVIRFADAGDFEDLAIDGDMAYVLRSDGTIFSFDYKNNNGKSRQTVVSVKTMDNEGLFFDAEKQLLYMAGKSRPVNSREEIRLVYQMKPEKIRDAEVALSISNREINEMISGKYPKFEKGSALFQFNPSAIAVHPLTGEKYILSALNRMLAIFDEKGLKDIFPLPLDVYYKPEGLAFSGKGDLYISSEGMKKGDVGGQIFYFKRN
jgi:uncharacterized protein YjiK